MKQRTFHHQQGIALGPILFMIAILAILAGAIAAGSGGFTANANKENAKITAATLIHLLNDYKTGYDMILANGGNPFSMPETANMQQANGVTFEQLIYDRSSPLYNAASDPFSSNGINITNPPTDFPILHPFAHWASSDPAYDDVMVSLVECTSDPTAYHLGGSGGYDCVFEIALVAPPQKLDDGLCTEFLRQVGFSNADPTTVLTPAFTAVTAPFYNQPMLCASGHGAIWEMVFWVVLAPHFPGTCDPSICY
jgi:type II secretory pathway pseudopilin PulG